MLLDILSSSSSGIIIEICYLLNFTIGTSLQKVSLNFLRAAYFPLNVNMNFVDHNFLLTLILVGLIFHRLKFSSYYLITFILIYLFISFIPIIFSSHKRTFEKYNTVTINIFIDDKI